MADHILDGLSVSTPHHGGDRSLIFDGEVLTVNFYREGRGDYTHAVETKHFRLTEVKQVWQEVDGG